MKSSFGIYIHSFTLALKKNGVLETGKLIVIALLDIIEDQFRNITAHQFVDSSSVSKGEKSSAFANFYQPVRSIPFRKLFRTVDISREGNFVDIGAGTGKAMLLAKRQGYERVRGVELIEDLVRLADQNRRTHQLSIEDFHCVTGDALNFEFESEDRVFFFNDPFSNDVFEKFLERMVEFAGREKKLILIYKNNSSRQMRAFQDLAMSHCYECFNFYGNLFEVIWMNTSPDQVHFSQ